jgi:hypothetical protein
MNPFPDPYPVQLAGITLPVHEAGACDVNATVDASHYFKCLSLSTHAP